jgi:hypothetical protein
MAAKMAVDMSRCAALLIGAGRTAPGIETETRAAAGDGLGRVVLLEENLSAQERVCRMNAVCEHHTATRSDWSVRAGLSSPAARRRPRPRLAR